MYIGGAKNLPKIRERKRTDAMQKALDDLSDVVLRMADSNTTTTTTETSGSEVKTNG